MRKICSSLWIKRRKSPLSFCGWNEFHFFLWRNRNLFVVFFFFEEEKHHAFYFVVPFFQKENLFLFLMKTRKIFPFLFEEKKCNLSLKKKKKRKINMHAYLFFSTHFFSLNKTKLRPFFGEKWWFFNERKFVHLEKKRDDFLINILLLTFRL